MKILRTGLRIILVILLVIIVCFGGFLAWATLKAYKPHAVEILPVTGDGLSPAVMGDTISLLTWNTGYAGLGSGMDFFYEGGKRVRPAELEYRQNLKGLLASLSQAGSPDFVFLQEADRKAKRSYYTDEVARIDSVFKGYSSVFATNYNVGFVPVPMSEPMGPVQAGLITLSHYRCNDARRIAFQSSYDWPKRLFMLQRCFLRTRYKLAGGKELVLINTHNSAFDDAADMRKKELSLLRKTMLEEFALGNYVIAGGDWNQNPLHFEPESISDGNKVHRIIPPISDDFVPGNWKWAFDPTRATNRDVNEPYQKGHTGTTIIDFFVVSPNIEVMEVKTLPQGFLFSDHQAVKLKVHLIKK